MGKQIGKGAVYVGLILLAGILVLGAGAMFGWFEKAPQAGISEVSPLTPTEQVQASNQCGASKQTTVSITLKNGLNTNTAETFDASYYIYQIQSDGKETQVESGSDTTSGSETLDCGSKYRLKLVTDGSVDNSRITGVYTGNAVVDKDGSVVFTTTSPSLTLGMIGSVHSTMEVRAYNEDARARMYADDGSNSAYEADGVTFWSTIANGTKTTVTAGSSMMMTLEMKATSTTADYNDYGVLVMFDASTSYWDKVQQVTFDGLELQEVKSSLNADELKATSGYEYVYKIPVGKLVDGKNHKLYFDILKSSGATGDDTLQIDFAPAGNYLSVDGYSIKTGAFKDTATAPAVYSVFDTNFATTT